MNEKKTVADYPHLVDEWHPTLNGDLKPEDVSHKSHKKVWWKCNVANDHEWQAPIYSRLKNGCPCCSGRKPTQATSLAKTHPEIAKEWHPTLNGNLSPEDVSAGGGRNIWWKCDGGNDHEWQAPIYSRLKNGCPCCSGRKAVPSNCLAKTNPELAKEWHPTLNGTLSPTDITSGSGKRIWWRCTVTDGHIWEASPNSRTNVYGYSTGCPHCCVTSRGEEMVSKALSTIGVAYKHQVRFRECKHVNLLPFDFMVKWSRGGILIEFQGRQHYSPSAFGSKAAYARFKNLCDTIYRDSIKQAYCRRNNIPLFLFPFWEIDRIPIIISKLVNGEPVELAEPPQQVIDAKRYRDKIRERFGISEPEILSGWV